MEIVPYDPSRRADIADLMGRVWGTRPAEAELEWFYERNPVRPASVLLGEVEGRVVATVAIAFLRMSIAGQAIEVGMPLRVATDPAYQGRGIFRELQAANEERMRELGIRLLLTVPNDASAPVFLNRLGWSPLPPLRVWARARLLQLGVRAPRSHAITRFGGEVVARPGGPDRVLRDAAWLNWRFVDGPTPYTLLEGGAGYGVARRRGRAGVVAAVEGELVRDTGRAAGGLGVIAAPPPWQRRLYSRYGYVPTPKSFTLLGKALHPQQPLPPQPHFELGDLDFF